MKLINNTEFEKYIHFIDYKKLNINEDLIKNTFLKPSLDKYILLDDYSYLFDKETKLTIYYNKYYWVSKLLSDYIKMMI